MAPLHADGRIRGRQRGADHRPRRRLPSRGHERQALPRRARRSVLRQHRLRLRRGDRPGGARADARAAVPHELVVRAPARDRARRRGRVARSRRPEPRLLLLGRLGSGRGGVEAGAPVLPGSPRAAALGRARARAERGRRDEARGARRGGGRATVTVQGDLPPGRLPRQHLRCPLVDRDSCDQAAVRAAPPGGAARPQHEPLPPAGGRDRGGVHPVPARGPRAHDPGDGARDGLHGSDGAGPERRRLLHAARGLFRGRAWDLRPLRHPAVRGRGDHRLRAARSLVRVGALRHPARTWSRARRASRPRTRRSAPSSPRSGWRSRSWRVRPCTRTG